MALSLASVALVASTSFLVNAIPIEQATAARPQWDNEWDNEWDNDDDDDDDDNDYSYGYGRRYRQNRGYRYGLGNWFNRQNSNYGRGYRSWNKRAVAATQHNVRSAQQGPWNPLSFIGDLLSGGRRDRDYNNDQPEIIYVPLPAGYSNGYPANFPGQIPNYPAGYQIPYPAGYPAGYPVAYYPPQGAGVGISQPLYAPGAQGAQGAARPQPKGWPPVIAGTLNNGGYPVGNVGFGIGSAGFTVDGPRPTPAPGYPVGPGRPATGITATLPGGVGNVGLGPISGGFSVDGGVVTPAPAPPRPTPVGPPAAGITGTLSNGNVPVGEVGLGIGGASFSVDGGNTAATPAPVVPSPSPMMPTPEPVIPAPSPVAPSPVAPPAAGITGTLTNGNTPVGEVGLGIGGASFSVEGSNTAATPAPVVPSPSPMMPSPTPIVLPLTSLGPSPVAPPAAGITGTLTNGNKPVGEVGLGIGGASFSVDGSNNVAPSAAPPAIPVDGGVVTPAPAPTPAPARPGGIVATLSKGANPVGVAGLGIGGSSFSVGN